VSCAAQVISHGEYSHGHFSTSVAGPELLLL